jgi:membrane associated rhomboid family serine protease
MYRLRRSVVWPLVGLLFMWAVFLFEYVTTIGLDYLGVYPREILGLRGILFSPFLHLDWGHLLSNSPPFLILTFMLLFFYPRVAAPAFGLIYVLAGAMLWAFGRPGIHIGASGVIYGLVAFLATIGFLRKNVRALAISLVIVFYYGGLLAGILPGQVGVSWDGHLFGALAGILVAYQLRDSIEPEEVKKAREIAEPDPEPFFPEDTFEKTKAERQEEAFWQKVDRYRDSSR